MSIVNPMLLSPSFIRRYTPPTCTLKIKGKQSLLSNWAGYPILKDVQFELNFDDPRLPEEERVTIQGDRLDLEFLCDAVTNYVNNFLQPNLDPIPLMADQNPTSLLPDLSTESSSRSSYPKLKPKGLLSHELWFNTSDKDTENQIIKLSVVQLFDLANALEEYSSELATIPNLHSRRQEKKQVSPWLNIAAGLILGVGVTTLWVQVFQKPQTTEQVALEESELPSAAKQEPTLEVIPPAPPTPTKPTPLPTLAPPIASSQPLPPPTPVPVAPNIPSTPTLSPQNITIEPSGTVPPYQPVLPPPPVNNQGNTGAIPQVSQTPLIISPPQIPNLPPLQRPATSSTELNNESVSGVQQQQSASSRSVETQPTPVAASRNTQATIPQVAEIQTYFQQNWKPPESLTQKLEYRLQLNPDGSLQRIIPVGRDSEVYLDQTNMPLLGQPFVSPLKRDSNPIVRLSLGADGSVNSSLED
jgi:hypothetical protein